MPPGRSKRARLRRHRGHAPGRVAVRPSQQGEMRPVGPDVFALDHPGAGILWLRYRRADPWVCGRPAAGAVSRRMHGDLHLWLPPGRHGCACAVGNSGRRARNAPDQVDERRLCMGVTWPVSSKRLLASQCLRITEHRTGKSGNCTDDHRRRRDQIERTGQRVAHSRGVGPSLPSSRSRPRRRGIALPSGRARSVPAVQVIANLVLPLLLHSRATPKSRSPVRAASLNRDGFADCVRGQAP